MRRAACLLVLCLLAPCVAVAQASVQSGVIAAGQDVVLDTSATVENLTVNGTLRFSRTVSTTLNIGCNLIVHGVIDMGTQTDPIPATVTHNLVFQLSQAEAAAYVGGPNFQPTDCGLWVMGGGRWDAHGAPVLRTWGKLAADVAAGATELTVDGDVSDWLAGGQIVVTQSSPGLNYLANGRTSLRYETEYATIATVNGSSTIMLTEPLKFARSGTGEMRADVGLITRNVTISTELENAGDIANDVRTRKFAHTMFMPSHDGIGTAITHSGCAQGNLEYVSFRHMGNYGTLGRYATHHHRLGNCARGMVVRGVSWFESGSRCTNLHESNGVLIEDTVGVVPGGGACHFIESDNVSQQQDHALVHNLVVGLTPKHFEDRNNAAIIGERLRSATGFWVGATMHEANLGNVSAGPSRDGHVTTGFFWPEFGQSTAGSIGRTFLLNEAHSHTGPGFYSWSNRAVGHDLVGITAWSNPDGFLHGAYGFPLYIYNAFFANNPIGFRQNVTNGYVQDSVIKGRGHSALARAVPDLGVNFGGYSIQPHPWAPSRFIRNTFSDLKASSTGTPGTAIWRDMSPCLTMAAEVHWSDSDCASSWPRIAANTYTNVHPYHFGWSDGPRPFLPNTNSFWVDHDRSLVLLRKDQTTPQGAFTPRLVNAQSFYDPVSDALATPFSALPSSITYIGLLDYRQRPYPNFTLTLGQYDLPPTVSFTSALVGTQFTFTPAVSADTTKIQCWIDWVKVCEDTQAPFEPVTVDLTQLQALGDILPPRKWAYASVVAFDGTNINTGCMTGQVCVAGYEQRAYAVTEITPELRRAALQPGPPADVLAKLKAQITILQDQIAQFQKEQTTHLADIAALTEQLNQSKWQIADLTATIALLKKGTSPAPVGAVAHDAVSESAVISNTASFSWTHTPIGTPRGVLVFTIASLVTTADLVSAVTYGGVALTAVPGGRAVDSAGEPGDVKAWFLGRGIPPGPQTVLVTRRNSPQAVWAAVMTVTAGADTTTTGVVLLQEDGPMVQQTVDDGSIAQSVRYAGAYSGSTLVPPAGANSTALISEDFGPRAAGVVRETTAGPGRRPVGFVIVGIDDRAVVHLAITAVMP